ncbi:MAG TPA: hypothetical protein VFS09_06445 [Candidatus Eisenbacteria bacterium]|nr:hypothetical protein [Candidatus Eisenbacteria bacterium]
MQLRRLAAVRFARLVALFLAFLAASLAAASSPRLARASVVLNEVFYDPAGEDTGGEFVELWNGGDDPEALLGLALEAGDGSRPGSWEAIFLAGAGDTIPARGLFLIGAARLTGAIQNGPDAVRISRAGVVLDRLGWGDLLATEFFEGRPAADAASGQSLARRGDGIDGDDNAADWEPSTPTPGAPNHPPYRVSLRSSRLRPEVAWPGDDVTLSLSARHDGTRPLLAGEWGVLFAERPAGSPADPGAGDDTTRVWIERVRYDGGPLAPGESLVVAGAWTAATLGAFEARAVVWTRRDDGSEAGSAGAAVARDSALVRGRVGAGPVAVNEFAFRDDGAGEWVELVATEAIPSWEAFHLGDATGAARRLVVGGGAAGAEAGELRVAASDPARFAARFAIPESLLLATEGGWTALNDSPSSSAGVSPHTDIVRVVDEQGRPCDAVPYEPAWSASGGSIERLSPGFPSASSRSWAESVSPAGGTPGAPNSVAAFQAARPATPSLLAAPRRVLRRDGSDGRGAIVLELGPGVAERSVRLSILDLRGRVRRRLAAGERFGGEAALLWDGKDDEGRAVEPGLYVARLEAAAAGERSRRASVTIAVAPAGGARR